MSILIVGEKPSVSRAISSVVGADKVQKGYTEGNGYNIGFTFLSWSVVFRVPVVLLLYYAISLLSSIIFRSF